MIECLLCHRLYGALGTHLRYIHNISGYDYLERFPGSVLTSKESRDSISATLTGKEVSNETRKRLSEAYDIEKHRHPKGNLSERFWSKVNKDGPIVTEELEQCWVWTDHLNRAGYGEIGVDHEMYLAHRVSWVLTNGAIPVGLDVLHKCDKSWCVRPSHLFLGKDQDNADDAVSKGRVPKGDEHWTRRTGRRPFQSLHDNAELNSDVSLINA